MVRLSRPEVFAPGTHRTASAQRYHRHYSAHEATAPQAATGQIDTLHLLRVVASFGIVWFHTHDAPAGDIAYAALPVFLLASFALISRRSLDESTAVYAWRRAVRLLIPWATWYLFYFGVRLAQHVHDLGGYIRWPTANEILTGPSLHLWYLPFAFAGGVMLWFIRKSTRHWPAHFTVAAACVAALAALMVESTIVDHWSVPAPCSQFLFAVPSLPLGFAMAKVRVLDSRRAQVAWTTVLAALGPLVWLILGSPPEEGCLLAYSVGTAVAAFGFTWNIHAAARLRWLADLSLGIYLLHPFILRVPLYRLLPPDDSHYALRALLAFSLAAAITWALRKLPGGRYVV